MTRLLAWVLNAAVVISTMLCVGTCVLWVQSHWHTDACCYYFPTSPAGGPGGISFTSSTGVMWGERWGSGKDCGFPVRSGFQFNTDGIDTLDVSAQPRTRAAMLKGHSFAGFAYAKSEFVPHPFAFRHRPLPFSSFSETMTQIQVPDWSVAGAVAILPFLRLLLPAAQRRHRLAKSLCLACGYDMRATPDRCPECGLTPKARAS